MMIFGWQKRSKRGRSLAAAGAFLLLLAALSVGLRPPAEEPQPALALALLGKTIVIDAGHGGFDPGAVGVSGLLEKDVNLAISQRVAALLRQVGATVVETRTEDEALAETKRADMYRRVEIAEECGAELFITIQANSIPQQQYRGAQVLQNTTRQAKSIENIYVVNKLAVPSIVVECGFLSNAEEEALLADSRYQQLTAYAIFLGIVSYYSEQPVAVSSDG